MHRKWHYFWILPDHVSDMTTIVNDSSWDSNARILRTRRDYQVIVDTDTLIAAIQRGNAIFVMFRKPL